MSNLVTIPLSPGDDEVLAKVVATFLAKHGVPEGMSFSCAVHLLVALERYSQVKDMRRCASALGVSGDTVEAYRKQASEVV